MQKISNAKTISAYLLATLLITISATNFAFANPTSTPSTNSKGKSSTNPVADNQKKKKGSDTNATNSSNTQTNIDICQPTSIRAHRAISVPTPKIKATYAVKTLTLTTNCGDIVIEADGTKAPVTVQVLTSLANNKFFDQTLCHRLEATNPFILQCGDPTGSGMGGPPFTYDDENKPATKPNNYPAGTVAMANAGLNSQGRGTNGSQFFIVYQDSSLNGDYTIWGRVTKGLDIVKQVAAAGVNNCDPLCKPNQKIAIIAARVK